MLTPAVTRVTSQFVPLDSRLPNAGSRSPLFGLDASALATLLGEFGEPAWRGRQLAEAIYHQRVTEVDAITTLPKTLRARLDVAGWEVARPPIVQIFHSLDGTERYLVECQKGGPGQRVDTVETVWMPEGDGGEDGEEPDGDTPEGTGRAKGWGRATICVSSQVGCAVNCQFCLTAKLGLEKNLTTREIAGQVVTVLDRHQVEVGRDRVNLVFMGMGEPFLNYDHFMGAVRLLVQEVGLSPRRMTVSTSGIVPGIERFAREPDEIRPRLAISLNAPNDQLRAEIMPINRKWPIEALLDALGKLRLRPRERVTFEYVLLSEVTDRPEHAQQLVRLICRSGLPAKVNLIAWNPGPGIGYATPSPEAVARFRTVLSSAGIAVYLRQPRGRDIYAACGQLKRTLESS
jgi:23S rRNA (adenine2503-C2)-methyltransferase